jgi:hypothetical protein
MTPNTRVLVEPPGTAPGSEPLITSAFIAIVRVAPDVGNIGQLVARIKKKGGPFSGAALRICRDFCRPGQNPALIFSNSSDICCRISEDIGNCASTGAETPPRPTASSASVPRASIATLLDWP